MKSKLTQERLKEVLDYDPETGIFTWKESRGRRTIGSIAGGVKKRGYISITVDYISYFAHRLAWLYEYGYFPENSIDHKNRNKGDNRISNLREVSAVCNARNCNIAKNNKTGVTGIYFHKKEKKFKAQIKLPEKSVFLGSFNTCLEAARARWDGEKKYCFPGCNTTSSAYQYLKEHGEI